MTSVTAELRRVYFSLTEEQRKELEQAASTIGEIEARFNEAYNKCQALSRQYEALTGTSLLALMSGHPGNSGAKPAVQVSTGKRMRFEDYVEGMRKAFQKSEMFTTSDLVTRLEEEGYHPSKNSVSQAIVPRMVEDGIIIDTGETQGRARLYRKA